MNPARWVGTAACLPFGIGAPASAATADRPAALVYVVNWAPVHEAALAAAEEIARQVLRRAGVPSEWRDCTEPRGRTSALCVPKAGTSEMVLEVFGSRQCTALRGSSDVLGLARLPFDGSRASQAAVFLEKADALARLGHASVEQVLGHAMAHEIGHLLLGSSEHTTTGLMRAQWSDRELQRAAWGQLLFAPEESARLQAAVAGRRRCAARLEADMLRNGIGVSLSCLAALAGLTGACSTSDSGANLTVPSALAAPSMLTAPTSMLAEQSRSHGLQLIAFAGSGSGIVNVTANARTGAFTANTQDAINVHGVRPNTILYVRASADVGLPGGQQADGVCQRALLGQFQPLLAYPGGPPATLETSPGGAGATHVVFGVTNPLTQDGASLDLVLRLVDALPPTAPTIDLRTPCFTLEIK